MEFNRFGICRIILQFPVAYICKNNCKCKRMVGITLIFIVAQRILETIYYTPKNAQCVRGLEL